MTGRRPSAAVKSVLMVMIATAAAALLVHGPMPQPASYHDFADTRPLGPLPNAQNVLSNAIFVIAGALGLRWYRTAGRRSAPAAWAWVFAGSIGIGLGSAYYHWSPSDATLVWDRLAIGVMLMAYLIALLREYVDERAGARWLIGLAPLGAAAVLHCYATGDLRAWALVQGAPVLATPIVLLLAPRGRRDDLYVWLALVCYAGSRAAELWDAGLYEYTAHVVSGHAAKHLLAGLGMLCLWRRLALRSAGAGRASAVRADSIIRSSP